MLLNEGKKKKISLNAAHYKSFSLYLVILIYLYMDLVFTKRRIFSLSIYL